MSVIDLTKIDDATRERLAAIVQSSDDFTLPRLSAWNYDPCEKHSSIQEGKDQIPPCQKCGILPHKHQRIGAAWSFLEKKCLLADQTGTGKTITAAAMLALMIEAGELDDPDRRVLIIISPSALKQWQRQLNRTLPNVKVVIPPKVKSKRIQMVNSGDWKICIIGYQTFNNDLELFRSVQPYTVIIDDVDPISNASTKTHHSVVQICYRAERVLIANATPLAKHLIQLYNTLEAIGGRTFLGSPTSFERRYVRYAFGKVYNIKLGRDVFQKNVAGYKNLDELKEKIQPKVLRRTADDIDDVELPALVPHEIYLDLHPAQREKYEALRKGAVKILKEDGAQVTLTKANDVFLTGQKICDGLATLGEADNPGTSVKFDFLEHILTDGALSDEKVVVFMQFKDSIRAMHRRFERRGIGYVTIWGDEPDKDIRQQRQDTFWNDPDCRVLIGTSALERSLNLQIARHLVAVDVIMNPARMTQLGGRVKRDGSAYRTVYLHTLLTNDTQEERYISKLQKEQVLSDTILGDESELYGVNLTPRREVAPSSWIE